MVQERFIFFLRKVFSNRKSLRIWTTHSGIHGPKPVGPRVRTKKTRKSRPESELNIFQRFLMVHGPLFYDSLWATGFYLEFKNHAIFDIHDYSMPKYVKIYLVRNLLNLASSRDL